MVDGEDNCFTFLPLSLSDKEMDLGAEKEKCSIHSPRATKKTWIIGNYLPI